MKNMIDIAKRELYRDLPNNAIFVDLVLGSGYESLAMAKYAEKGIVYAFGGGEDIENACKLFEAVERGNIRLINDTPDNLEIYLVGMISCAICRVHDNTTMPQDKIAKGISKTLSLMKPGGKLLIMMQSKIKSVMEQVKRLPAREYNCISLSSTNNYIETLSVLIEKL